MRRLGGSIIAGVIVAALVLPGCRKPPPATSGPAAAPPAVAQADAPQPAPAPAPHLGGALPGKAQTRVREVMDRTEAYNQLHQIGIFLLAYNNENGHYPTRLEDFLADIKRDARREHESLQTGYFVMTLNPRPAAGTVVVYEKDPDTSGMRLVVLADGSVQRMNEAQFKAAVPAAEK
jgi:hypothetical protein